MNTRQNAAWLAALLAATVSLAACGDRERSAEAETGNAEVEVTTNLPEGQVSDQQLKNAAEGAAAMAETPQAGASVVVSPPGSAEGNAAAPAAPPAQR